MSYFKTKLSALMGLLLVLGLTSIYFLNAGMSTAEAANATRAGYSLPNGHASRWIGSYTVAGGWAICADKNRGFSGSETYSRIKTTKNWRDSVRNKNVSKADVARVAWILHEYSGRIGNRNVSAAIDASVYAIFHKGIYDVGGRIWKDRIYATGHGRAIENLAKEMVRDSKKFAGPYKLKVEKPKTVQADKKFEVKAKLTSKTSGEGIKGKKVTFQFQGDSKTATTNKNGKASVKFSVNINGNMAVKATAKDLANNAVNFRTPSNNANQRVLVKTSSVTVDDRITLPALTKPAIQLTTRTQNTVPWDSATGAELYDTIRVRRALSDYSTTATARLYGPYPDQPTAADCQPAELVGTVTVPVNGNGSYDTPTVQVTQPGYYTWIASLPASNGYDAATHRCGLANETAFVGHDRSTPVIDTTASDSVAGAGSDLYDNVEVSGIELPCVNADGNPVANPDGLPCGDLVLEPAVPAVPAVNAVWETQLPSGTACFTPEEVAIDWTDPAAVSGLEFTPRRMPADLQGAADAAEYWRTIGTQAECESIVVTPGTPAIPEVNAEDLPPFNATLTAELWGPYETLEDATCMGTPYGSVEFDITGNGTYQTPTVNVGTDQVGVFTWVINVPGDDYVEALTTECGLVEESTTIKAQPEVTTLTSEFVVKPGAEIFDNVYVTGTTGDYTQDVVAELWGPYNSRDEMTCEGTPYAEVTFPVEGDGEYITPNVTLDEYGFYTWVERFAEDDLNMGLVTECGLEEETTLVQNQPKLVTQTSDQETTVGSSIFDTLIVSDVVGDNFEETVEAHLYGPFSSLDDMTCAVKPYATVEVTVDGNGTFDTPSVTVDQPGYYTWHETFEGNEINAPFTHDCGLTSETTFVQKPDTPKVDIPSGFASLPLFKLFPNLFGKISM